MNATHKTNLFNSENQTMIFSYTRFPVNKINVDNIFKIMRKLLFNYSFYSHPEIGKFQGVTTAGPIRTEPRRDSFARRARRRQQGVKMRG
jgi:hypothetical protein